jgi:hypothetical protein
MTNLFPLDVRVNLWGQTFNEVIKRGGSVDEADLAGLEAVKRFQRNFRKDFKAMQPKETAPPQEAIDEAIRQAQANGQLPQSLDS